VNSTKRRSGIKLNGKQISNSPLNNTIVKGFYDKNAFFIGVTIHFSVNNFDSNLPKPADLTQRISAVSCVPISYVLPLILYYIIHIKSKVLLKIFPIRASSQVFTCGERRFVRWSVDNARYGHVRNTHPIFLIKHIILGVFLNFTL
jgi:hypothetical protein